MIRPHAKANLDDIHFNFDTQSRASGLSSMCHAGVVDCASAVGFIAITFDLAHSKDSVSLGDVVPSDSGARYGCACKGLWKAP